MCNARQTPKVTREGETDFVKNFSSGSDCRCGNRYESMQCSRAIRNYSPEVCPVQEFRFADSAEKVRFDRTVYSRVSSSGLTVILLRRVVREKQFANLPESSHANESLWKIKIPALSQRARERGILYSRPFQGTRVAARTATWELLGSVMLCTVLVLFNAKRYAYRLKVRLSLVPLSKFR